MNECSGKIFELYSTFYYRIFPGSAGLEACLNGKIK